MFAPECDLRPNPTSHLLLANQYDQLQQSSRDIPGLSCVHFPNHFPANQRTHRVLQQWLPSSYGTLSAVSTCESVRHNQPRILRVSCLTQSPLLAGNGSRLSTMNGRSFEDKFLTGLRYGSVNICASLCYIQVPDRLIRSLNDR